MAATPQNTTTASSQPESKPYKWVTLDEAAKLEKFLFKHFIPKNNPAFAKKFFYRVESIIPYTPAKSGGGPEDHLYQFMVQKYYRDKTETVNVASDNGATQELERNARVEGHQMINGKWQCVDETANMLIDSGKFKAEYIADNITED